MAEDMVERVAVAIYNASSASEPTSWEAREEYVRDNFRAMAIDAIEAMRVPTEHMLNRGACFEPSDLGRDEGNLSDDIWRSMIEGALADSTTDAIVGASNSR